ncbi:MAG: ABC transporter ATP-binding protein [Spirochaetaceae bacterium]|nr:ABC transporter ATP-binding protein [Spirochaetaceae bacterium]
MIEFRSMTFGYGKRPLFEGLELELDPGSIYGLLGLNGAGKTSLLKIAAGALRPTGGGVTVFGANPGDRDAARLADTVFVAEDPWLPPLKPKTWLDRYAVFRPAFDRARFAELIRELALDEDKLLTKYSYGQRKKFALAAAIASGARVLLLDEPTNGLDIPSKAQFRRLLASAAREDRVIIVSTHQVRDLENLIDPVVVVHGGKVLFTLDSGALNERLAAARLPSLEGHRVVYAERDAVGWTALLAAGEPGPGNQAPDLELVFNAAIAAPDRLAAALRGDPLPEYRPEEHALAKEARE